MEQFFHVTTDAILFLDRDYNFTFLNATQAKYWRPAGPDLVGRKLYELFPAALDQAAPFAEAYRNSMERGISLRRINMNWCRKGSALDGLNDCQIAESLIEVSRRLTGKQKPALINGH
jgi:hypothetical protein